MPVASPIRVLVVDDHPIYACGVADCLSAEPDIQCVGTAQRAEEALALIESLDPDVVILDVFLTGADAATLASTVSVQYPKVAMLAMCDINLDYLVVSVVRAGIDGYLLKKCDPSELATAIRIVARGESYLPPAIASKVVHHFRLLGRTSKHVVTDTAGLTERELKVLELLVAGRSNREIAALFCLSERTVENHVHNIYRKLGVHGRTQAALVALQRGYVDLATQQISAAHSAVEDGGFAPVNLLDRMRRSGDAVLAQNG